MELNLYIIESINWSRGEKIWETDDEAPVFASQAAAETWLTSDGRGRSQDDGWYTEPYTVVDTDNYRIVSVTFVVTDRMEVSL